VTGLRAAVACAAVGCLVCMVSVVCVIYVVYCMRFAQVDESGYVPVICGLARCNKADIDAAWEAVRHAKRPRIHTFIATSAIHMEHKLRKSPRRGRGDREDDGGVCQEPRVQ